MKEKEKPVLHDFNAAELLKMDIPEPKWAVSEILPEGLSLLAGKPKRGKSMMALNLAISITNGALALGRYKAVKGPVIYLALEDTKRRLKNRLEQMLTADEEASDKLIFYNDFPRMHQDGISLLEERIQFNSGVRLVIIDTLGKFRPPKERNAIQYDYDYEVGTELKALADRCEVSILMIHHMRKTESEDKFDDVIGSFGVTGSADGIMLLIRKTGCADGELHITGRDLEEIELAMRFNPEFLSWNVIGDVRETAGTDRQQRVLNVCLESKFPVSPKEVSKATGLKIGYVQKTMKRLSKQGLIAQIEYGLYDVIVL